jgi:hypothetical protein
MTVYNGRRGRTPLILNLSTRWRWMANTSATLTPVKNLRYQLSRRPDESKASLDVREKGKNVLPSRESNDSPFAEGVR